MSSAQPPQPAIVMPTPTLPAALAQLSPQLLLRLVGLRLLVLDVDGVMTDGGLYFSEAGETKRFDVRDGAGIVYLNRNGVEVAVISGRKNPAVDRRCKELGILECHQGVEKKLPVFEGLLAKRGLLPEQCGAMGDDLADLPLLRRVGVSFAPSDAVEDVRTRAAVVTKAAGGRGAIREASQLILEAQGRWQTVVAPFLE